MRTQVNNARLVLALAFLLIAVMSLVYANAERSTVSTAGCVAPRRSDPAIRECVASKAKFVEPSVGTWIALVFGGTAAAASLITAARSTRRIIGIPRAAEQLGVQPGYVRRLVEEGVLEVSAEIDRAVYLNPEQVQRLGFQPAPAVH